MQVKNPPKKAVPFISAAHSIPEDINLVIVAAMMNSVHTWTGQGLTGQTLPLDVRQELDKDEELLAVACETLDHHAMAEAQKMDKYCLNHLAGNCLLNHLAGPAVGRNGDTAWTHTAD